MLEFAWPWMFLLLPLPILAWWWLPPYRARQASVQVPFFDRLAAATGQVPVLAGSGSTWFVAGAFPGEGRIVAQTRPAEALAGGNFADSPSDRGAPERR